MPLPYIVYPVWIGEYSYAGNSHIAARTGIGRYVSIGEYCTIGAKDHHMDRLSTFPLDHVGHDYRCTFVQHDAWIGNNSVIISGVTIGIGAVIGAGSIVTRDIPHYAIAYGQPARVQRYRFNPELIGRLLASKWWELPIERVRELPHDPVAALNILGG